jgi:hypothetical protein
MKSFGQAFFWVFLLINLPVHALHVDANLKDEGVVTDDMGGYIDPKVDYTKFIGRVSDKDKSGRVLKIKVENDNTKFLKPGDELYFEVNNHRGRRPCRAFVRSTEEDYFTMYVQDFTGCWRNKYFKRGFQLNFTSGVASQRVLEASEYRKLLVERKESFLRQLNKINHWLWTYDQQRIKLAADYDIRINDIKKEKRIAIDNFLEVKKEQLLLQKELQKRLDDLEISLDHYKIERNEQITDRWDLDHDSGVKFPQRPLNQKRANRNIKDPVFNFR